LKNVKVPGIDKNSVYGELKLSEQLAFDLQVIRQKVNETDELLEQARYERDQYKSECQ